MFFIRLLSKTPFFLLYPLSTFLFYVTYYVVGYRKKVVFTNLKNSFPEKSEPEIESIAKDFYRNLLDVLVETIKMLTISPAELTRRMHLVNPEALEQFYNQQKSVIVLTAHYYNWEWLTASSTIQIKHAVDAVYLKLNNEFSENLMKKIRERFGGNLIEKKDFVKSLIARKNILKVNALMADQAPRHEAQVLWTTFLNQESKFFTGAERIAQKLKLPVLYIEMQRVKRGYYTANLTVLTDDAANCDKDEITLKYVKALENTIRKNPSGWLWSHKRWKHKRQTQEAMTNRS